MLKKLGIIYISTCGAMFLGWHLSNKQKLYDYVLNPFIQTLPPEVAHTFVISALRNGLVPKNPPQTNPILKTKLANYEICSPIGLAAGFDKNARGLFGLSKLGFSFLEVGTVTPQEQPGNSGPRLFKLKRDKALINRMGFNNEGADEMSEQIDTFKDKHPKNFILGINIGKNKLSEIAAIDYRICITKLAYCADYLVLNVSSPNTPGLRDLQGKEQLSQLLLSVKSEMLKRKVDKPLFLKISPDLSMDGIKDIVSVVQAPDTRVDGLIISNSTLRRNFDLHGPYVTMTGGLTGKPIRNLSTQMIRIVYNLTNGQIPIIGVGGVFTGDDAFEKIKAGASLVQIYTAFVYEGPTVVRRIENRLAELLEENKFNNVSEAIGIEANKK
ncbi:Dihydroorotate dehydrogenase (quinone), mitochondrial [Oopsacas minuta]|uniref:Dihydroorotate dehydrogenase (quinone), mitochondrial n=1 Tax=Oopsacas minuta TaxID=111878 RepID=A0AAV7KFE2_9METZ|nr:Dihydroorotate dehydrogenase (quinone), mitochondrial [Oopsacas minuta]